MSLKALLLLGLSSVTFSAALAQNASDQELRLDKTLIVTTPGPDRQASELIGNATALERDEILSQLTSSLGDTLIRTAAVSTTAFGQGASRPVLRGLGAERVQVLTNGIGVIDASAASPDHQVSADGIDAERIEILRGPAALAYGGQAIGGVVNVIDGLIVETLPEEQMSGDLYAALNSVNDGQELAGRATLTSGPLALTLSASQRSSDDYDIPGFAESAGFRALEEAEEEEGDHEEEEETRGTLENSFADTQNLAAGLSWVTDSGFIGVALRQQTSEYGLPGHGEHAHGEEEEEGEEEEMPFIDLEHTRIDMRAGFRTESPVLKQINASLSVVDYEHTEFEAPGEAGTLYSSEGYEARFELDHELAGFDGALGLQLIDTELSAIGEEAFLSPTDTSGISVFLYETQEWESGLGVEGGLRVETIERDNRLEGARDFNLFSASLGVHRHLPSGLFIGGQLSVTERAPNEAELFADGPHLATEQYEIGDAGLNKESGLNLEGTLRWRGDQGGVGINLFATEFTDFIYLEPFASIQGGSEPLIIDALPVFGYVQQDASFLGGEIYGDYSPDKSLMGADWTLQGSLDFVRAELDSGSNVPYLPPMTLKGNLTAAWAKLQLDAYLTIAADQDDPGIAQLATNGYTQIDLRAASDLSDLGLGLKGTEVFIEVRNLTDEDVRYATSVLKDVAPAPGQNIRAGLRLAF